MLQQRLHFPTIHPFIQEVDLTDILSNELSFVSCGTSRGTSGPGGLSQRNLGLVSTWFRQRRCLSAVITQTVCVQLAELLCPSVL